MELRKIGGKEKVVFGIRIVFVVIIMNLSHFLARKTSKYPFFNAPSLYKGIKLEAVLAKEEEMEAVAEEETEKVE